LSNGEDTKNFKLIVKPKSNLYPEPDVKFGDSKSSIVAKFGTPDDETSDETSSLIAYSDYSNAAPDLIFVFDSSNKLSGYAVVVRSMYSSIVADFLSERYLFVNEEDNLFMFINGLNNKHCYNGNRLQLYSTSIGW
jgi:hypothetical protein